MKTINLYKCEVCGTTYNDPEKAKQCEKNHKMEGKIVDCRWLPISSDRTGYPDRIKIDFGDGKPVLYKR